MVELCCRLPSGGGNSPARPQHRHPRVGPVSTPVSRSPFSAPLSQKSRALHLARAQQFAPARQAFQSLLEESPGDVKAWISWAQMEKRGERACGDSDKYPRCRLVLQRALTHNLQNLPGAAQLCQAWGLLEVRLCLHGYVVIRRSIINALTLAHHSIVAHVTGTAVDCGSSSCRRSHMQMLCTIRSSTLQNMWLTPLLLPAAPTGQHLGSGVPAGTSVELRPPLRARPPVAPCAAGKSRCCRAAAAETGAVFAKLP